MTTAQPGFRRIRLYRVSVLVVGLAVVTVLLLAAMEIRRLRKQVALHRHPPSAKDAEADVPSKQGRRFLREFANVVGVPIPSDIGAEHASILSAHAAVDLHRQRTLRSDPTAESPFRSDFSATYTTTVSVQPEMQITVPEFTKLHYTLTNRSDRTMPAPILYQQQRWDSPEALIATAGFREIRDEVQRALAIWRFVSEHADHAFPVTRGSEEHDVVKFFAMYGYGFCDDVARAAATLAELSSLESKVWFIGRGGTHVLTEIRAGGRWRMFDTDMEVYFHRPGLPDDVLGLDELAADRSAFGTMVARSGLHAYREDYIAAVLDRPSHSVRSKGTAVHSIRPVLRKGESITFTNYHWGRFFLGANPMPGPRLRNGCVNLALDASHFSAVGCEIVSSANGFRLLNRSDSDANAKVLFSSAFPIVGGHFEGSARNLSGTATMRIGESECMEIPVGGPWRVSLDGLARVLTKTPAMDLTCVFILAPGADIELTGLRAVLDFQCAPLAVLPLKAGSNRIQAYIPDEADPSAFQLTVATK